MTPLHLHIALFYHCHPGQFEMVSTNEVRRSYAMDLCAAGLLRELPDAAGAGTGLFEKTDGLAVWIAALCSTPFPELRWVMPSPATRAETNQREATDAR